jgi:hypothetical protein
MPLEWLNHFIDTGGQWLPGQPAFYQSSNQETFPDANGRDIRLHETARSGSVLLSPVGGALTSYGDAEVYLTIIFADGTSRYLSAPLRTPIRVNNVRTLQLFLLVPIGNVGCTSVTWRTLVNAHCIYERL